MEKYPNIQFVGWVAGKDKQAYFKKAKALVFTSLCYETFGLSVAEARSYGIPCIVQILVLQVNRLLMEKQVIYSKQEIWIL